jgi:uncharacterized membrane protein
MYNFILLLVINQDGLAHWRVAGLVHLPVVFRFGKVLIDLVALVKGLIVKRARVSLLLMKMALGIRFVELGALTIAIRILVS